MITIEATDPSDSRAVHLLELLQSEYVGMYGEPDPNPEGGLERVKFPSGDVLVMSRQGVGPIAVGGWTVLDAGAKIACLRRMYVHYNHRGQGYSRILLGALESSARKAGMTRIVLETGRTRQTTAIHLYRSAGYTEAEPFGFYRDAEDSIFLGRDL